MNCFFVAVLAVCYALGRSQEETLTVFHISPCNGSVNQTVSRFKSDIYAVKPDYSLCFNKTEMNIGLRVVSWAASVNGSVGFISRQASIGVVSSWNIPLNPDGFTDNFSQVNRTMCNTMNGKTDNEFYDDSSEQYLFYVDVFSSSPEEMQYSISIEAVYDYVIELDHSITTTVDAASPQIHYFKFPNDSDTVTVEAFTENDICAFVSIQNKTCPVNDLLRNAMSRGIYQTMSKSAFLTVEASDVNEREFILVLITTNYSFCHSYNLLPLEKISPPNSSVKYDEYKQDINIIIKNLEPISNYIFAIFFPFILFLFYVSLVCVYFFCLPRIYFSIKLSKWCKFSFQGKWEGPPWCFRRRNEHEALLQSSPGTDARRGYGATDSSEPVNDDGDIQKENDTNSSPLLENSLVQSIVTEVDEAKLLLPRMCKIKYYKLKQQYRVYSWNTVTVGIFYALPAFQLVLSEQQILRTSGNQDRCYYNFKCTHPLGVLTAFNNQWSNVGYILLGLLFLLIISIKKYLYEKKRKRDQVFMDTHGIPQFFGIYQAMGIALITEGFMSAFYHICPTGANFQFDTAFMFILGGLFLVKLFQIRHPDINANAFIAFFSFAVVIFMALIGIYLDRQNPLPVRITMFIFVLIIILIFFFSFYRFHEWGLIWSQLKDFRLSWSKYILCPNHKWKFVKLCVTFLANLSLMIFVIADYARIDIATSILAFFVVNLVFFLFFYVMQKFCYSETITVLPVCLVVMVLGLWTTSFYFFIYKSSSNWELTPAESREINHECVFLDFYDYHDIWHFLSASAMFFSFLFLLTLDDGMMETERKDIHIF